jgi:hypothetical protein
VSITSPSDYSASVNPSSISVSATANGNGKTLQKVDFYAGSVLVGTDSSSPYTCSWTNFTPGNNYCLYAKATTTDSCSAVSLPVHVKIAPTYEQVGSTLAGPYATPNSVASDTVFSSTGDIPTELTIQNGVIPDQCIEYTLSISGVTGYTSVGGNSGLALFAGSTPSESDGLFTGVYHYDNSVSRGALADDLAESSTPYGPQKTVSSSYTVTVDVTDGVINTYLNGVHWQSYAPTAADMANWAGQTKFATFHSGPGTLWQYAKASISNVKFYKPSKVATPTFSPTPGTYTSRSKIVTISCATSGATIRYTTDGSEPLPDSTQYTGSITITGSCMIKAKAFKPGYKDSDTASGTYTISRVWTQTGSTIAGPYWTPDATGGGFSSTIDMPSAVTIQGGAIPDMKVEYTLTLTGISGYGDQRNGNSGLAMFLSSTPSSSDGAFTGVSHPNYSVNHGAIVGNAAAMPDPDPWSTSFNDSSVYTVAVEIAGGVATTTVTDVNCRYYSVTSTDVSNWSGQTKFAAFHSSPGVNWDYARAGISNIKFYTGETTVSWVQVGDTITTEYATPDPYPNGYSSTAFSSTVDMPSELAVSGGVVPDFKVTYDVNLIWHSAWGAQYGGNSGMALYQSSTPSATGGLYCGLNGQWDGSWYSTGAFTGNAANVSGGNGYYSIPGTWPALTKSVTVEKIGSTVTTTVTGMDNRAYTVTSTDISNWAGKSKFAAFRGPSGQNWMYNAVGVQNITFYRGE